MSKRARTLALTASMVLAAASVDAQSVERRNVASVSPLLGLTGFARVNVGAWAISYERRVGEHLGLLVEVSGVHVHGPPMHVWLFGGTLGARWHFAGLGSSPFVGLQAGYRTGWGRNAVDLVQGASARPAVDDGLTPSQLLVVANAGYRWVHSSGLTVTGRLGAGFGPIAVAGSADTAESAAVAQATRDVLGFTALAIDTELSVGYAF